jgi:hypothetical protein
MREEREGNEKGRREEGERKERGRREERERKLAFYLKV